MDDANHDPSTIRSLAVSPEDVVDAFVYGRENPGEAVLRVTPPFHGRMRARIHVYRVDDAPMTGAVHVAPSALLAADAVETYPRLGDDLADADAVASERIRQRRAEAVEEWRERARESIADAVDLETGGGHHRVDVKLLG